jgi:hypothetical protein
MYREIKKIIILFLLLFAIDINAQVENLTIRHPVYDFLLQLENKGLLQHESLSDIPISIGEIKEILTTAYENREDLNKSEKRTLNLYLEEFNIIDREDAVVFYSETEKDQLFFDDIFSSKEKFIYHYDRNSTNISIIPLSEIDFKYSMRDPEDQNFLIAALGTRISGTIDNRLGYNLQVTNGSLFSGERSLAVEDPKYGKNIKFAVLEDDVDITESHVNFKYKWFEAGIGRENRMLGAGLQQNLFISDNSPAFDALTLAAHFKSFEYKYFHGSLLALPEESVNPSGFNVFIPSKYVAIHRFAVRPCWGEIAFWENVVYTDREPDLAYLNPFSFFKSVEHSLRDRDNSVMGLDASFRFLHRFQLKGSYLLDDIIFSKIGTGFWSNKTAWNIALIGDLGFGLNAGVEYTRVEPYTYSHFNYQNSMTHDGLMYASNILPNSERFASQIHYWWGGRYPLKLNLSYTRHGNNILDSEGNLIKNVGGDPLQTRRIEDPETVTFLDGDLQEIFVAELSAGFEIVRGLNVHGIIQYRDINGNSDYSLRTLIRLYDF